ncbi:uncharacterized protein MONBRDRAFT_29950 [Monosiga brevicollis MX1]|uniref:Sulfatase N-terminal domain-containing protein n=1 Tax=Monosiga brevicollis TaxID=81824 RepID=A9VCD9_MONBE|nr:uncharacterized protein MONBRDRAFT_29950 [Monosiga brevicollis MX1]EDQ84767.1 predicted protein [Monosiga brevicollis MX1]|eukprot:XP_001750417.1 hypothetical protein [Monosiga brevicollis MX1]
MYHNIGPPSQSGNCMHVNTTNAVEPENSMFGLFKKAGYNVGVFGKLAMSYKTVDYIDSPLDYNNYVGVTYQRYFPNGTNYTRYTLCHTIPNNTNRQSHSPDHMPPTIPPVLPPELIQRTLDASILRYEHLWDNSSAPTTPNYNYSHSGAAQHVRQNPPLTTAVKCWEDQIPYLFAGPGLASGVELSSLIASTDLLPTLLELAGVPAPALLDGKSFAGLLKSATTSATLQTAGWRTYFLVEYLSVGTYFNDHSNIWQDGNQTSETCNAANPPVGPAQNTVDKDCIKSNGTGTGNCYFVDSTASNSWRMLRIISSTENTAYVEYDPSWQFKAAEDGTGLQWYELYDLDQDPYQMHNLFSNTSSDDRLRYHNLLSAAWSCSGSTCP